MKITLATSEHLGEILEINRLIDYENPDEFMQEQLDLGRIMVSCNDENKVLGYSLYQIIWGNTPQLSLVKVLPEFQGNNIGTSLVKDFESVIKDKGFKWYLSSTELSNLLSQRFHDKLGFYPIGELDMPHGKELFYRKDLQI